MVNLPKTILIGIGFLVLSSPACGETLKHFVESVLNQNPQVQSAHYDVKSKSADVNEAIGNFLPSLSVNMTRGNEHTQIGLAEDTLWTRENSISVEEDLFTGGRNYYTYKEARYTWNASKRRFLNIAQSVALQAITAYFNIQRNRQLVNFAKDNVQVHKKVLSDMRLRFKHQAGRRGEVELAEARLALAQSQLDQFISQLRQAKNQYLQVAGRLPPKHLKKVDPPKQVLHADYRQLLHTALEQNPNYQQAEEQLRANQANVKVARSRMLPDLSIRGSTDWNDNINGIKGRNNSYIGELVLSYDVFDGGSDYAAWNSAEAQAAESAEDLENTRRTTIQSVADTWASLHANYRRMKRFSEYVQSAAQVAHDYHLQFRVGRRPLFNVLDAEREKFNAQTLWVNAKYNYYIQTYQLLVDTGQLLPTLGLEIVQNE